MKLASLTFKNGMGGIPSDVSCDDSYVELSEGMIYDDGEYKPIIKPLEKETLGIELLYIHKFGNYTNFIGTKTENNVKSLYWDDSGTSNLLCAADKPEVTSIGNTLIVKDGRMRYFLFKNDGYTEIGELPKINARIELDHVETQTDEKAIVKFYVENLVSNMPDTAVVIKEHKSDFNSALTGHVLKVLNENKKRGYFHFPFFVRLAYRMYDGSHSMITNPILMFSSVERNEAVFGFDYAGAGDDAEKLESFKYHPNASDLKITLEGTLIDELQDYSDIIDGIDVFVSEEVIPYDFNDDWKLCGVEWEQSATPNPPNYVEDGLIHTQTGYIIAPNDYVLRNQVAGDLNSLGSYSETTLEELESAHSDDTDGDYIGTYNTGWTKNLAVPKKLTEKQILKKLEDSSIFYLICELGIPQSTCSMSVEMENDTLLNLTSRPTLEHDDYFNHCRIEPKVMFAYNNRLHLGNIKRYFFEGYDSFLPSEISQDTYNGSPILYYEKYIVEIDSDSGVKYVTNNNPLAELIGYYFYYPDPRAKKVYFKVSGNYYSSYTLKKHPNLNGAYWLKLPSENKSYLNVVEKTFPSSSTFEILRNQLMVSEVNNPFYFTVDGNEDIGTGNIKGMSSNTEALSNNRFGECPLYVFTDEGIWGMVVNDDGTYGTAKPLSRDVCNNHKSITQTDNAVFFISYKGLMAASGNTIKCVSNAMLGKDHDGGSIYSIPPFRNFIKDDISIAYDYKNRRLWLLNGTNKVYIYSIKEGTFAVLDFGTAIGRVVNIYPDNYIQDNNLKVYSLLEAKDINEDTNVYNCKLVTRPLKLGSAHRYKQIRQVTHLTEGIVSMRMFSSDKTYPEISNWKEETFFGRGHAYHKLVLNLTLKPWESYGAMIIGYEEWRSNRLLGERLRDSEPDSGESQTEG